MKQTQTKEGRGPTRAIKYECTVHAPARGASNAQALLRLNSRSPCPLQFHHIPRSGYISPDAMVTCMSSSTKLEILVLGFNSPATLPDESSHRPPSSTRVNLPTLLELQICGCNEYIEDFVGGISAPQLTSIDLSCHHFEGFDFPQLGQFIDRIQN